MRRLCRPYPPIHKRHGYRPWRFAFGKATRRSTGSGGTAEGDQLIAIENVYGSTSADTLTSDAGANILQGNSGDDIIYSGGGWAGDNLFGEAGNEAINATGSVDAKLRGGAGNDTLIADITARDYFYFEDLAGTDTITNFLTANDDQLVVDLSVFGLGADFTGAELVNSSGVVASGAFAQFIYDTDSKQLWFDADGTLGVSAAIHIATLTGGPASLSLSDFDIIA